MFLPCRHRVHLGVSHPEDAGLNTGLPVATRKEHGAFQEWYGSLFIYVLWDRKLCRVYFLSWICWCAKDHAGCLPGVYTVMPEITRMIPGRWPGMVRVAICEWVKAPLKNLKNVHLSEKTVTVVLCAGTPRIKIRDDPCYDPWMCENPLSHTLRRAMDAAIARSPFQICDNNSEQPVDFFCKKREISDFLQKRSVGCLQMMSQIWKGAQAKAVSISLFAV